MRLILGCLAGTLAFAQGIWENRAPYPVALTEVSGAVLNNEIYSLCGLTETGRTTALYIYNPRIDSWRTGRDYPIQGGGDHCNVAAANGKLYLLGAIRIGAAFVDGNTYEYDPVANSWQTVAQMGTPRGASGVAVIGSKIYVAGGLSATGSVSDFEVFDTVTKTWMRLPNMPTARDHLTAQALNGKFYAVAGRSSRDLTANEEFDPATNSWRARAPVPTARGGLGSGVLANRIQVFGGEGNSGTPQGTFRQNEEYDPGTDTWRNLADMPTPRHGMYGHTLDGRIFVPGGGPRAGGFFSNSHEVFYLAPSPAPVITSVRNAASADTALAPGSLVSAFGERLAFGEQIATQLPLPSRLNASSVRVNGVPVPVFFTSTSQINFVLPADMAAGNASLIISNAGVDTPEFRLTVADSAPGIFTLSGDGKGQGAVLIAGTGLIARATRDAFSRAPRKGEVVEIYCTGLGANPAPVVTIGGARADVLYAGTSPSFPGLQQINARIANDTQTGIAVTLAIQIGQRSSNTVTIAVID